MSTPSPEKDSLLGQLVREKIAYQNLKWDIFFGPPFSYHTFSCSSLSRGIFIYSFYMNFPPLVRFFCVITLVTFESYLAIIHSMGALRFLCSPTAKLPPPKPFLSSSCCLLLHFHPLFCFAFA